jgi:CIC family chloride channel protein
LSWPEARHPLERLRRFFRAGLAAARHGQLGGIVFWAALIGIGGAISGVAFRTSVRVVQRAFTGRSTELVETAAALPWWARIAVPTIGGACAGALLWAGGRVLRSVRSVDYMEAVAVGNGQLGGRAVLLQVASSFFSIGSGGSIGREGPMVQLAAMLASQVGRWTQVPIPRQRLLVACGAAAGIAAAYNAPIAGALFVAEVVLGSIAMESFGPLIVASVVSDAISRQLLGAGPVYRVPHIDFGAPWELALYALLGVVLGHFAPTYLGALERARAAFRALHWPAPATLALGGLIVGVISVAVPEVWGNGYSVVNTMLNAQLTLQVLAVMLAAKLVSTAASVGSGAVGGILTPTLFMGAALGAICGALLHRVDPHSLSQLSAYAVVGMGALLAATTHAPLTSILLIFEMTLDYDVVLPLMLACVTAHYVARIYLRGESVYTRSLRATLVEQDAEWRLRQIGALVRPPALVLQRDEPLRAALSRAQARGAQRAYVVDDEQQLVGELDLASVRGPQRGVTPDGNVTVAHHMIAAPAVLTPDMLLGDALDVFIAHRARRLPVVAGNWSPVLLGEVSRHDLLLALQDRMTERPGAT